MEKYNLNKFLNGWLIGDFEPTILKTSKFEVAIKKYKKGECEKTHFHKIATELTAVISGKVRMGNEYLYPDEIIWLEANEATDFEAVEDTITVVIKIPSIPNDKIIIEK